MANPSKTKGDRAELDAVRMFQEQCPELCLPKAQRLLGAGRAEDVGDLHVFGDVAIQVRNYAMSQIGTAIRSSAKDACIQASNGDRPLALGLVPYPRARNGSVKWVACVKEWPVPLLVDPVPFAMVSRALTWLRDDDGPHGFMAYPRELRIAILTGGNTEPVLLAPVEAWVAAYRDTRQHQHTGVVPFDQERVAVP